MSRTPVLSPAQMTPEQLAIYNELLSTRGGPWFHGPYDPMLQQPRLAEPAQRLGKFLRYHTSLPPRLSEMSILLVARYWDCELEWHQHAPIAARAGLAPALIEVLRLGGARPSMQDDEAVIYDFVLPLLTDHRVSDADYENAKRQLGAVGVVELTALVGYYTFLAFAINAHEVGLLDSVVPPFAPTR